MNKFRVTIFDNFVRLRAVVPVQVVNADHEREQNLSQRITACALAKRCCTSDSDKPVQWWEGNFEYFWPYNSKSFRPIFLELENEKPIHPEHQPTHQIWSRSAYHAGSLGEQPVFLPYYIGYNYPVFVFFAHHVPVTSHVWLRPTKTQIAFSAKKCLWGS